LVGSIRRCDLDFSNIETIIDGTTAQFLALDPQNNHVYWTDWRAGNRILRAELDGGNLTEVIVSDTTIPSSAQHRARGLSLDLANDKIYWTEGSFGVFRANLDGTDIEHLIDAVLPGAIIVDEASSKIIYAIANSTISPSLFTADLDGTNIQPIVSVISFVTDLEFADIDPSIAGDMNWDNQVGIDDLLLFVGTLLNPDELLCNRQRADVNGDGDTNGLDIASFVNCLLYPCP